MKQEFGTSSINDLNDLIELLQNAPRPDHTMQMVAGDYSSLSDDEFRILCSNDIHFIGGLDGVRKMKARMKKLGITP